MKQTVKTGVSSRSTFDLSSNHITTMDFGTVQPTYIAEIVPNDTFHVSMRSFARLAPLAVPTFGKLSCTSRAFFVPMRSIFHYFDEWITRSNDPSLQFTLPQFTNSDLVLFLRNNAYKVLYNEKCDFTVFSANDGVSTNYCFTQRGRWFYKILLSLGYSVNFAYDQDDSSQGDITPLSALPLLAFIRVCYDYIFPSQYVNGLSLGNLFDHPTGAQVLSAFSQVVCAPFAQDYFTSAWKDINRVGDSDNVSINVTSNLESQPNQIRSTNTSTSRIVNNANGITSMALRLLTAVSDYVTRNNIAGSRYFEQLKARFGISAPSASPNRSIFLRSFDDPISIQDVTATATTERSVLGEQGAKGIQSTIRKNEFTLNSSADTYGFLIVLSHVMPDTGYYQGRKRHTLHLTPFDFFTPEFEKVGLQAIRNDELFSDFKSLGDYNNALDSGGLPSGVFGFSPRYIEYKKMDDYLTGDFRLDSANVGLDSYHMFRYLTPPSSANPLSLNSDFLLVKQNEFDRIFQQPTQVIGGYEFKHVSTRSTSFKFLHKNDRIIKFNQNDQYFFIACDEEGQIFIMAYFDSTHSNYLATLINGDITNGTLPFVNSDDITDSVGIQHSNSYITVSGFVSFNPHVYLAFEGLVNAYVPCEYRVSSTNVTDDNSIIPYYRDENLVLPVSEDSLISAFSEYFDHFYSIFRFDVTANRTMMSISESMPIENGGSPISVDYEGFNFSV